MSLTIKRTAGCAIWLCVLVLARAWGGNAVSARDFGAKGDGVADDTDALQAALNGACASGGKLRVPRGTYNIRASIAAGCALTISGDGPKRSIIRQMVQRPANHALVTRFSLALEDIAIETEPLRKDFGMAAVFRSDIAAPADGQTYAFLRYRSSGFNFALDVAGAGENDQLDSVTVRDCDLSVGTSQGAVSQPVNVRTARSALIENNTLTGDFNNDHGIYLIAVRTLDIRNNRISGIQNSAIKILNGGFCGRTPGCPPDARQDYRRWTIEKNRVEGAALAVAVFLYGTTELPLLDMQDNEFLDIADSYAGDAAAVYVNVNESAVMKHVSLNGNRYDSLSLGGVFLVTSGGGRIETFEDREDRFRNWSLAAPGRYSAISANGSGMGVAAVTRLSMEPGASGKAELNLQSFSRVIEVH